MGLTAGIAGANGNSKSTEYQASSFESQGTNVFRAGKDIAIVIPQISGTGNVFDAVLVSLEDKANEQTVHTSSYGVTISTNLAKTAAGTLGANVGASDSYNSSLNDAYVHGAVDFVHSQVKNQGCLVMNIDNAGASTSMFRDMRCMNHLHLQ